MRLIYEGLTGLDEKLQTVPGAAESRAYNANATELTFTLRAGLQYSDGTPLNAKRFAYSILRNIDPTTHGEYASITDEIVGAAAYRNADVANLTPAQLQQLRDAVEVRAGRRRAAVHQLQPADCRTLRLRFTRPAAYFHTVMSLWVTFPAKEELIAAGGTDWWRSPQYQIGNGPFVMTVNTADTLTRFTPNPRYWRGRATYDIEYRYMADSAAAFAAYQADHLDIIALAAADRGTVEAILCSAATLDVSRHLHLRPDVPQLETAVHRSEGAPGVRLRHRPRSVGARYPGRRRLPDLDLDSPKGYPGYDATETRWGYQSQPGAAGPGGIELRQRSQPADGHGDLCRHSA